MWNFSNINSQKKLIYKLLSDSRLMLAFQWLIIGVAATLSSITGSFSSLLKVSIFFPVSFLTLYLFTTFRQLHKETFFIKFLATIQTVLSVVYLTGFLIPEVAFDAVWYHLPVIKAITQQHGLIYLQPIYQSLNPLFTDLIYGIGYSASPAWGTKVIAYLFFLSLIYHCYHFSSHFVTKKWAIFFTILVSTFQVIAWQSTSFYVDLPKAYWEIASLLALLQYYQSKRNENLLLVLSACFFGASLGTKLFSLFLLPVFWLLIFFSTQLPKKAVKDILIFSMISILVPLPFYLFAYYHTGNPLYSFSVHLLKLGEIGGNSQSLQYLFERTLQLPLSLLQLLVARDYTSPVLILTLPLIAKYRTQIWKKKELRMLLLFSGYQFLIWWYVPPLSTRYALSGFITWALLSVWALQRFVQENPHFEKIVQLVLMILLLVQIAPRVFVATKNVQYFFSNQTQEEYIRSKFDGTIDRHLKNWYGI